MSAKDTKSKISSVSPNSSPVQAALNLDYVKPDPSLDEQTIPEVNNRLTNVETLTRAVFIVILVSLIATLVAVAAIFMDQLRANNDSFQQYKQATDAKIDALKDKSSAQSTEIELLKQKASSPIAVAAPAQ